MPRKCDRVFGCHSCIARCAEAKRLINTARALIKGKYTELKQLDEVLFELGQLFESIIGD